MKVTFKFVRRLTKVQQFNPHRIRESTSLSQLPYMVDIYRDNEATQEVVYANQAALYLFFLNKIQMVGTHR